MENIIHIKRIPYSPPKVGENGEVEYSQPHKTYSDIAMEVIRKSKPEAEWDIHIDYTLADTSFKINYLESKNIPIKAGEHLEKKIAEAIKNFQETDISAY